jgi:hypothetical protein
MSRPPRSPLRILFLLGLWQYAILAPRCAAQTAPSNQAQASASPAKEANEANQAREPSQAEPKTRAAAEREARFLTPPPRPQTFRPQRGQRTWEREGRQRLVEARGRLWARAHDAREQHAETIRRLRPEPAAEGDAGAVNPRPASAPDVKANPSP